VTGLAQCCWAVPGQETGVELSMTPIGMYPQDRDSTAAAVQVGTAFL
jgi:hypothetical protein